VFSETIEYNFSIPFDPYCSGERGSNENNNRLIRRFIPKGTCITNISEEFIQEIEDWMNNLPRPMFQFKTSLEMTAA